MSVSVVWMCGRITPHDLKRLVQFTLYTRHSEGQVPRLVNFSEYESFMEEMLELFGDDTDCGGGGEGSSPDYFLVDTNFTETHNQTKACYDAPWFRDSDGEGCDFYTANADAYCARSGDLGTLAFMNQEGMDASRACCACGGGTPEDPTPTLYDTDNGYSCSGTLIHPRWVLTSASCASTAKHVELAGSEGCPETIQLVRALVHPGHEFGGDYDVGLLELATPSSVMPVQMYEGGDLGYNDCHALEYIAALVMEGKALVMQLGAQANEECDAELEAREGLQRVTRWSISSVSNKSQQGGGCLSRMRVCLTRALTV